MTIGWVLNGAVEVHLGGLHHVSAITGDLATNLDRQVGGLHAVRIVVGRGDPTIQVLTEVLGFKPAGKYGLPDVGAGSDPEFHVFEVGPGGLSAEMQVEVRPDVPRGYAGIGGVHRVAFRTPNSEEHLTWHDRVDAGGLQVTPVIERFYFKSIYFREPGGVLV